MPASTEPRKLVVQGKDKKVEMGGILVGDVWLLGGQSYMEFELPKVENGQLEVVSANFPKIRLFSVPQLNGPDLKKSFLRQQRWGDWSSQHVKAESLISLCWASANFDETVFENPEEVRLDRKPNPHIAFGSGPHICLGAPHARLIVRSLLRKLCDLASSIELLEAVPKVEKEADYHRHNSYDALTVRINAVGESLTGR